MDLCYYVSSGRRAHHELTREEGRNALNDAEPVIAACFSLTSQRRPKGDSNPGFAILHNDLRAMGISGRR